MKNMNIVRVVALAAGIAVLSVGGLVLAYSAPIGREAGALDKKAVEGIVHDYLMEHPDILVAMTDKLKANEATADQKARDDAVASVGLDAVLDPKISFVTGPADAKVTLVEFFDYRCTHCKASLPGLKRLFETEKNIRFAFVEFPILTQDSVVAARAAVAARRQDKYVPFHFALMATTGDLPKERILSIARSVGLDVAKLEKDMADPAITDSLQASHDMAKSLHIDGTPSFLVNNKIVVGELSDEELSKLVRDAQG